MAASPHSSGPSRWRSTRFMVCYLACSALVVVFLQRVSLSMAIVCMVNHTAVGLQHHGIQDRTGQDRAGVFLTTGSNGSEDTTAATTTQVQEEQDNGTATLSARGEGRCQPAGDSGGPSHSDEDGPFAWDKPTQGLLLAAVYVGYTVMQIPGSYVIHRYGVRLVAGASIVIMSVCHALCHPAALLSPWAVMVLRIAMGVCTAFTSTAMYGVWTQWAPKSEQAQLLGLTFAGEMMACAIVFPLSALLCQYGFWGGWPSVFYVFGGLGVVWSVAWFLLMTDSPETHPWISPGERHFIVSTRTASTQHTKHHVPWKNILTSPCVWAIVEAHFVFNWGYFQMISNLPTFLYETMHFDITSNGLYSMLPYIALSTVLCTTGFATDAVIKSHLLSVLAVRKLVTIVSNVIPATLLVLMSHLPCDQLVAVVALLVAAVGVSGLAMTGGFFVNHYDIAPRYAINIFTITNTIATVTGIINPYVVAAITVDQTREQWQMVFYVTAGVLVAGTVIFCLLAKAHVQEWARPLQLQKEYPDLNTDVLTEDRHLNAEDGEQVLMQTHG